jgi:hypothetical protein
MIFAVATDERTLYSFPSAEAAIAYCEALDVAAAVWLFWDDAGRPLEPHFTVQNKRGLFVVQNGSYILVPASEQHHAPLDQALSEIVHFDTAGPLSAAHGVRAYISQHA